MLIADSAASGASARLSAQLRDVDVGEETRSFAQKARSGSHDRTACQVRLVLAPRPVGWLPEWGISWLAGGRWWGTYCSSRYRFGFRLFCPAPLVGEAPLVACSTATMVLVAAYCHHD